MTEAELQDEVLGLAAKLGLLAGITPDSRRSPRGEPDLRIAGPRGQIWAELKDGGGRLKPAQVQWKYMLLAGGARWVLWRPRDWVAGRVQSALRSIACTSRLGSRLSKAIPTALVPAHTSSTR